MLVSFDFINQNNLYYKLVSCVNVFLRTNGSAWIKDIFKIKTLDVSVNYVYSIWGMYFLVRHKVSYLLFFKSVIKTVWYIIILSLANALCFFQVIILHKQFSDVLHTIWQKQTLISETFIGMIVLFMLLNTSEAVASCASDFVPPSSLLVLENFIFNKI